MLYLLDANVLITANRDYYPLSKLPEFWEWLLHVAEQNFVRMPAEMCHEILMGNDDLENWLKKNKQQIQWDEIIQPDFVRRVTNEGYGGLLDETEVENIGNDSFLIAYCLVDQQNHCVVTTEASKPNRERANRHIPDVFQDLGIHCCNTFELLRSLNFSTNWKN